MEQYAHDGLTFDVTDAGPRRGEPVVLLHGYPQTRACWDGLVPRLANEGYRVLAPDQRGYSSGARPRGRRAYRLERLTADVLALADAAGIDRFHVVGHDWGGAVAWALASRRPDRLRTMTSLATPHAQAMKRSLWSSDQLLRSWYIAAFQLPVLPELALRGPGQRAFRRMLERSGLDAAHVEAYVARLQEPGAATAAINWYRAVPYTRPDDLGPSKVPTLYVYGTADFALGPRAAELTADHVDAPYRFVPLEGEGHWLPERAPDTVAELLVTHAAAAA